MRAMVRLVLSVTEQRAHFCFCRHKSLFRVFVCTFAFRYDTNSITARARNVAGRGIQKARAGVGSCSVDVCQSEVLSLPRQAASFAQPVRSGVSPGCARQV